ncbi:oxidoreductase [Leptolyngbya sp. AN02str]|uniref:NADH-quinone oxidoreductase subunit B family protein n=1 Tax=Leptolyngbya sp. AN02str TaxID=3423363 RepID=UPI003D322CED
MNHINLATVWLGGCSGCHMSFLDLDEWLFTLADQVNWVYSPFMDVKVYPNHVDVVLVEGAIANRDHLHMIYDVRERSRILISFGDCAVTGNVTALRNPLGGATPVLERCYLELSDHHAQLPGDDGIVPPLLDRVLPVHTVVPVDIYLPGCPPSAERIRAALEPLLQGTMPHLQGEQIRFG